MHIRDRIKDLRRVRAGDLRPHPKNWRKHPEEQQNALRGILAEVGFVDALMVRELPDGGLQIVDGHLRAETTPDAEVPVLVVDLDEAEADKVLATFDPLAAMAEPDEAQLEALLKGISTDSEALAALLDQLAKDAQRGQAVEVSEDDVPEPPDEAITKPGDLWILGEHRLLCGDSSKPEDVDRLLGGQVIHLVNTDPPYNVKVEPRSNNAIAAGLSSFSGQGKGNGKGKKMRAKDRPLANDFVTDEAFDEMLLAWFGNMARVLEPGRSLYIWGGYANCANYPPALKACGIYFSQAIIWDKQHPVLTRKDFMGAHEWCFYCWKEGAAHKFFGPANVPDLWQVKKVTPQKMVHLCLHPDAQVMTEAGFRAISTITAGDRVYAGDGSFHRVEHVSSHCYTSSHLYRIRARGGNATTDASDNHPFLIWRPQRRGAAIVGSEVAWVRADELRRGDYTMTPILEEPRFDPDPEHNEDYWFLFGLYLAQGTIQKAGHGENRYPSFHLHKKRRDLATRIHQQWSSVSEYDPNEYGEENSQGLTVMAFDPQAGDAFERLGGRRSHAKRLDPAILRLPRAKRLAVLQGWLAGDGCKVHDRTYWQGITVSEDLATHLCLLAESVGYRANVFSYDPPEKLGSIDGRQFKSARRAYYLYFYDRSQYQTKRGSPTTIQHDGRTYALRYVRSVERIPYAGDVWNLTVEGHPSFQTSVGLSHNTEKPVELAARAMQYSSRPGENVLDLFGGSGSTLIAAEQTGRRAFLMELDPPYCDVIVTRYEQLTGKKAERVSLAEPTD
jgi:DNA modification methylase